MEFERTYSMMITKQPEWIKEKKINANYHTKPKHRHRVKIIVIDTEQKTRRIFASCREADLHYGWSSARASQTMRDGKLIGRRYKVVKL